MQPYRLALASTTAPSCLDPPIRACESPPPRDWRLGALVAITVALAGVAGAFAGRNLRGAGHVEIAPTALAHARAHAHPPRAARSRERNRAAARTPTALTTTEHAIVKGEHDPKKLVLRAKTLASLGLDLTVVDVPMSEAFAGAPTLDKDFWPASWEPVYDASHRLAAFQVGGLPVASSLRVAGLTDGDRILAVDGWDFEAGADLEVDANKVRERGWAVVELVRGGHHVVLSIRWRPSHEIRARS